MDYDGGLWGHELDTLQYLQSWKCYVLSMVI
mgnify:CR=1 FL=1